MRNCLVLFLIITLSGCGFNVESENQSQGSIIENPFIHTAYFWLNENVTEVQKEAFIADCEKLAEIETVRAFFSGSPANTDRDVIENTYDYAVVFHFENLEDQEYYQQHPLHLEMIEKHQEKWERVMVTDIEH